MNVRPLDPVSKLIFELSKLPGVGEKTATRLSYFILKQERFDAHALAKAIIDAKEKMQLCHICSNWTDQSPCRICSNISRQNHILCVVERPCDLWSIEQSGTYQGLYHVLHGTLSPLEGIGPEELKIQELLTRVQQEESLIQEVILANNPCVEGEATALYLSRLLKKTSVRITQLASGLPVGGLLEYMDRLTIGRALSNRTEIH